MTVLKISKGVHPLGPNQRLSQVKLSFRWQRKKSNFILLETCPFFFEFHNHAFIVSLLLITVTLSLMSTFLHSLGALAPGSQSSTLPQVQPSPYMTLEYMWITNLWPLNSLFSPSPKITSINLFLTPKICTYQKQFNSDNLNSNSLFSYH